MSAKKFNAMLHDMGIQFKQGDTWVLYSKYQGNGYLKVKTHNYADPEGMQHAKEHSYWTQKGRLFLYDFLRLLILMAFAPLSVSVKLFLITF